MKELTPTEALNLRKYAEDIILERKMYDEIMTICINRGFTREYVTKGLAYWGVHAKEVGR